MKTRPYIRLSAFVNVFRPQTRHPTSKSLMRHEQYELGRIHMDFQETAAAVEDLLRPYCEVESARRHFLASVLGDKHPVLDQIPYSGL